jgi:TrmH family RNA methyltransferase
LPDVKALKKLLASRPERADRRQFLAEGANAVSSALASGAVLELFTTDPESYPDATVITQRQLEQLTDARTPQPVVALCRFVDVPFASVRSPRLVAICADVRDPGNAGTVIRCADAAGADAVVLAGDSVDAYNPKTVRASVGSLFHLPVVVERDAASAVRAAQDAGLVVLAADGAGERDLFEIDGLLEQPTAWLFGNEAWGLPPDLADLADHRVRIPIHGQAESLNLATAAALCLYASARVQS